jgi:hypothetical protein
MNRHLRPARPAGGHHAHRAAATATLSLLLLSLSLLASPAHGAWPSEGAVVSSNLPSPSLGPASSDGTGGLFLPWLTSTPSMYPVPILGARLASDGERPQGWPLEGRTLLTMADPEVDLRSCEDGAGGAYVLAYGELSSSGARHAMRLARVLRDGSLAPGWPDSGLAVGDPTLAHPLTRIEPDGRGGVLVAWMDAVRFHLTGYPYFLRTYTMRTCVMRFGPDGTPAPGWPAGGVILADAQPTDSLFSAPQLALAADGAGGAYVARVDSLDGVGDLWVSHVDEFGGSAAGWTLEGRTPASPPAPRALRALVPSAGGAVVVAWSDAAGLHTLVNRLDAWGTITLGWPSAGLLPAVPWDLSYGTAISDGGSGTLVIEATGSFSSGEAGVRAFHVLGSGSLDPGWPFGGVPLFGDPNSNWVCVEDGSGGAFVSQYGMPPDASARVVHLRGDGTLSAAWPVEGTAIADSVSQLRLLSASHGAAIALWQTDGFPTEFRALRLSAEGGANAGVTPALARGGLLAFPDPSSGPTRLAFSLARAGVARVDVFDVSGRRVRALVSGTLPAGAHERTWDGRDDDGRAVPAGLYLVRARGEGLDATRRVVRLP